MRVLSLFNVDFAAWPVHLLAKLALHDPAFEADAVVVIDKSITSWLKAQSYISFDTIHCLSLLEPDWICHRSDTATKRAQASALLGAEKLELISLADRELTDAWAGGAVTALSPLREAATDWVVRQTYVANLVLFLERIMRQRTYDLVLSFPVQDGPSVAAAFVAEQLGIPFLSPKAIGYQVKTCLFDDSRNMRPSFRFLYAQAKNDPGIISESSWARARKSLDQFRLQPVAPDYMSVANASTFERPSLMLTASLMRRFIERRKPISLRSPYPGSRLVWEWRRWLAAVHARKFVKFQPLTALGEEPFAYAPLHYEPEASLLVSAPEHANQFDYIERAAQSLPQGWRLAVKEHQPMLGRRPTGYYERLAAIPGVVLLSPFEPSFSCIAKARLTLTITGTAGFEAVLLGKPAVFAGPSPIQLIEGGAVYEPDLSRLPDAIKLAVQRPPVPDEELVRFLAALDARAVEIPAQLIWGGMSSITNDVVLSQMPLLSRFAELIQSALADMRERGVGGEAAALRGRSR